MEDSGTELVGEEIKGFGRISRELMFPSNISITTYCRSTIWKHLSEQKTHYFQSLCNLISSMVITMPGLKSLSKSSLLYAQCGKYISLVWLVSKLMFFLPQPFLTTSFHSYKHHIYVKLLQYVYSIFLELRTSLFL